jgi:hypothetical protein
VSSTGQLAGTETKDVDEEVECSLHVFVDEDGDSALDIGIEHGHFLQ